MTSREQERQKFVDSRPSPEPGLEVVEPEEKAKRMTEARQLYNQAFGEMKKNPADAKARFQKVIELAGAKEPLSAAAMKWIRQIEASR